MGNCYADHVTPLYPQKLALTSPTGGGRSVGIVRSRTKATEFSFSLVNLCDNYVVAQLDGYPQVPLVVKVEPSTALNDMFLIVLTINLPNNYVTANLKVEGILFTIPVTGQLGLLWEK